MRHHNALTRWLRRGRRDAAGARAESSGSGADSLSEVVSFCGGGDWEAEPGAFCVLLLADAVDQLRVEAPLPGAVAAPGAAARRDPDPARRILFECVTTDAYHHLKEQTYQMQPASKNAPAKIPDWHNGPLTPHAKPADEREVERVLQMRDLFATYGLGNTEAADATGSTPAVIRKVMHGLTHLSHPRYLEWRATMFAAGFKLMLPEIDPPANHTIKRGEADRVLKSRKKQRRPARVWRFKRPESERGKPIRLKHCTRLNARITEHTCSINRKRSEEPWEFARDNKERIRFKQLPDAARSILGVEACVGCPGVLTLHRRELERIRKLRKEQTL